MGALGRSGRVALGTAPSSLCWHLHRPPHLQGRGRRLCQRWEAGTAQGSVRRSTVPFARACGAGRADIRGEGQVSPESQYLEISWAHVCPPLRLLAMDPGQLI